jgi:hypothetical protein
MNTATLDWQRTRKTKRYALKKKRKSGKEGGDLYWVVSGNSIKEKM